MRSIIFALGLAAANAVHLNLEPEAAAPLPDHLAKLRGHTGNQRYKMDYKRDGLIVRWEVDEFVWEIREGYRGTGADAAPANLFVDIIQPTVHKKGYVGQREAGDLVTKYFDDCWRLAGSMIDESSFTDDGRLNTLDLRLIADKALDHNVAKEAFLRITNAMSESEQDSLDRDALASALVGVGWQGLENLDF